MHVRYHRSSKTKLTPCLLNSQSFLSANKITKESGTRGYDSIYQSTCLNFDTTFLQSQKIHPCESVIRPRPLSVNRLNYKSAQKLNFSPVVKRRITPRLVPQEDKPKSIKVFLSDQQTRALQSASGTKMPGAPPATPTPTQTSRCEYIPSLHDIRGQRTLVGRLTTLREKEQKKQEMKRKEDARLNRMEKLEKERELKRYQRNMVYALNKLMTEFELKKFEEYKKEHGLNG